DKEVALHEHRVVLVPQLDTSLLDRRTGGEPGDGDDDIDAAEREDGTTVGVIDGVLASDVHRDAKPLVTVGRGGLFSASRVNIRNDHAGAVFREGLARSAADAARATGDESDAPLQIARGRGERELVALQRPALDGEGLRLG